MTGLDDLLACFCAGLALNWNGTFLREVLARHDEVNSSIDVLLNFGCFMYIGAIMPWSEFNQPDTTGITPGRLIGLGFLVLFLRRIPAIMAIYKAMPHTVKSWKEALFMGYFGPIGIGAVFYVEHGRHLFPSLEDVRTDEEENMLRAMGPVVYFLVLFSIVVHGLSIPALESIYRWRGVQPIMELAPSIDRRRSMSEALPPNSYVEPLGGGVVRHNRFSRAYNREEVGDLEDGWSTRSRNMSFATTQPVSRAVSWVSRPGRANSTCSRATSRNKQVPETPVFKLGDNGDGGDESETTIKDEDEGGEKDGGPRIQFVDEDVGVRSPRLGAIDVGSAATSFRMRDGVGRAKFTGAVSFRRD